MCGQYFFFFFFFLVRWYISLVGLRNCWVLLPMQTMCGPDDLDNQVDVNTYLSNLEKNLKMAHNHGGKCLKKNAAYQK